MSKQTLIVILLWILGAIVDILWIITDKEKMNDIKDMLSSVDGLESIPEATIATVFTVFISLTALVLWPSDIVLVPYKAIKQRKKET